MAHIVGLGLTFVAEKVDVKLVALVRSILKLPLPNTIKTVLISVVDVFFNGRLWTTSNHEPAIKSSIEPACGIYQLPSYDDVHPTNLALVAPMLSDECAYVHMSTAMHHNSKFAWQLLFTRTT